MQVLTLKWYCGITEGFNGGQEGYRVSYVCEARKAEVITPCLYSDFHCSYKGLVCLDSEGREISGLHTIKGEHAGTDKCTAVLRHFGREGLLVAGHWTARGRRTGRTDIR